MLRRFVGIRFGAEIRHVHVGFHLHRSSSPSALFIGHRVVVEHHVFGARRRCSNSRRFLDGLESRSFSSSSGGSIELRGEPEIAAGSRATPWKSDPGPSGALSALDIAPRARSSTNSRQDAPRSRRTAAACGPVRCSRTSRPTATLSGASVSVGDGVERRLPGTAIPAKHRMLRATPSMRSEPMDAMRASSTQRNISSAGPSARRAALVEAVVVIAFMSAKQIRRRHRARR